jgi:hypothetical protein
MRHVAAVLLLLAVRVSAEPVKLFVSPLGRDTASGRLATEPLASPEAARDTLRKLRAAGQLGDGAVVTLAGGTYFLPRTLTFTPADSGTAGAPIVWCAAPGETVVISGGQPLRDWRIAGAWWQAKVEAGANFSQLFVNGERRFRPRLPRSGYAFVAGTVKPTAAAGTQGADRFRYAKGDLSADWANRDDLEVLCFHIWSVSRLRIADLDEAHHTVTFQRPTWHPSMAGLGAGSRYIVDNVKEALGQPGDWYLDRPTATLTYVPKPGETPETTPVVAPRLETIVAFAGDVRGHHWVEHLTFRSLTFAHANWLLEAKGRSIPQAESTMGAALECEGLRDTSFEDCRITGVGGYGIELGNGTKRCRLERCELTDLGGGGVKIGPGSSGDDEAVASHNVVRDCLIAHGGRLHPPAVGLWLGYAHHNLIDHNEIADFYYSGISAGWSWGYGPTTTHDNTISGNLIHDEPQRVLGDEGGIYTLGVSTGTVISGNVIHDQVGVPWGVGIYLDEGSTGITVRDNLVYRCTTHSFNVNYGRDNVAENNIFGPILDPDTPMVRLGRDEAWRSMTVRGNLFTWNVGMMLDRAIPLANGLFASNLYWPAAGKPAGWGKLDFAGWQATGQDAASLVADPLFVDPEHGNYDLRPGSPAAKVGFRPFDWRSAGRLTKHTVTPSWPAVWAPATPPPPVAIFEDFEDETVGAKCELGQTMEDGPAATARVTDETAAPGGHRCLKFTDAPGQPNVWNPHVYYTQVFTTGTLRVGFDLRLEPGSPFEHSWRDGGNPWHTGPSLSFGEDGWLTASGRKLLQLPHSTWFHVSVTCALGDAASGRYDVEITVPGRPPAKFTALKCDAEFKRLGWCGFVSIADKVAVIYLDNVSIGPQ